MARANCPYALGFRSLDREVSGLALPVTGRLPDWLSGSLFRTGPAKFEIGRQSYTHWFDGLAMLHGFHFNGDTVRYSNRFVRSHSFCEAMDQGRIARGEFMTDPCRTMFGRVMTFFDPKPSDNTNVNVSVLDEQLVALTETPLPIRFDPRTLETMGNIGFDSAVKGQVSTAHPHSDGTSSYFYTIDMGRRSTYKLFTDKNGSQNVLAELPAEQPSYMHSFGMSEHYLILTEFPLRVNPLRLAFSSQPFIRNYRWDPKLGTMLTVVDKTDGSIVARARAAPCFGFHHVNAYESDGAVFVDLLAYPNAEIIEQLRLDRLRAGEPITVTAILTRFRIPLNDERGAPPVHIEQEPLCSTPFELPRIDYARRGGRSYRIVWGNGQSRSDRFLDTIVKIELWNRDAKTVRSWAEDGCYAGEPVFVARPDGDAEDDGVLLSVVLDAEAGHSFLLVLNAATLEEQARAAVPHHIPFGFHGNYFPDADHPDAILGAQAR
jgi:beta,beta-carotene 9',10'-dioxygenase